MPEVPSGEDVIEPFKAAKRKVVDGFERSYLIRLLARTAGLPIQDAQRKLGLLLLRDFVEQAGDRWRLSAGCRASSASG